MIKSVNGRKIGIIGFTTPDTATLVAAGESLYNARFQMVSAMEAGGLYVYFGLPVPQISTATACYCKLIQVTAGGCRFQQVSAGYREYLTTWLSRLFSAALSSITIIAL